MENGSIFKELYGVNPRDLTIEEIEEKAIKEVKFKNYGGRLVIKRGNIFKTKKYNINNLVDKALSTPILAY